MSLDRSLKTGSALIRHRNVLTRAERLEQLEDENRWQAGKDSAFGLPKVAHRKLAAGKKTKKAKIEEGTTGLTAPTAGSGEAAKQ